MLICIVKERLDDDSLSKLEEKKDLQKVYKWSEFKIEVKKIANQLACRTSAEPAHAPRPKNIRTLATVIEKGPSNDETATNTSK